MDGTWAADEEDDDSGFVEFEPVLEIKEEESLELELDTLSLEFEVLLLLLEFELEI